MVPPVVIRVTLRTTRDSIRTAPRKESRRRAIPRVSYAPHEDRPETRATPDYSGVTAARHPPGLLGVRRRALVPAGAGTRGGGSRLAGGSIGNPDRPALGPSHRLSLQWPRQAGGGSAADERRPARPRARPGGLGDPGCRRRPGR